MKITRLLLPFFVLLPFFHQARTTAVHNRISDDKRVGYWCLNMENEPVSANDPSKVSEGKYVNGRKEGVWIYYYENTKQPRLIGEYSDNRPSGTYFRFNQQGKMFIASANNRMLNKTNRVESSNQVFSCELNFENNDVVAGQVFFHNTLFRNNSFRFWVGKNFESSSAKSSIIDFSWLHNSYNALYAAYLDARKVTKPEIAKEKSSAVKVNNDARKVNYNSPPFVKSPIVAEGLEFKPNGMNKLFTKNDEIWMDGFFREGQLVDGKVFLYDRDGVLLKVRIYKKGVYFSDGGL